MQTALWAQLQVDCGINESLFLCDNGSVYGLGRNDFGQLGGGIFSPPNASYVSNPLLAHKLCDVRSISMGFHHSVAVGHSNMLWSWGWNQYEQLGIGNNTHQAIPQLIMGDVKDASSGYYHSVGVKTDGTVFAFGRNNKGQLGDGSSNNSSIPVVTVVLTDVMDVETSFYFNLALKSDGTVWAWGDNQFGQIADGNTGPGVFNTIASQVPGLNNIVQVATGSTHGLALRNDGTVWAWGSNSNGQLGDGMGAAGVISTNPVQCAILDVKAIAAGDNYSIFLKNDGTVWFCGVNVNYQFGDGNNLMINTLPIANPFLTDIESIGSGYSHSIAVKIDGTILGWGYNCCDQLGMGNNTEQTPIVMPVVNCATNTAGDINLISDFAPCYEDSVLLQVGMPFFLHHWTSLGDTIAIGPQVNLPDGDYLLLVVDTFGCTADTAFQVNQEAALNIPLVGNGQHCLGDSTLFSAPNGYSYSWTDAGGFVVSMQNTAYLKSGNYDLEVTDPFGCTWDTSLTVGVFPNALFQLDGQAIVCQGDSSLWIENSGYPSYQWKKEPAGIILGQNNTQFLKSGTYTLLVTDNNGCFSDTIISVMDFTTPFIDLVLEPYNCYESSVRAVVQGGYTQIQWIKEGQFYSADGNLQLIPGNYQLNLENNMGCKSDTNIQILEYMANGINIEGDREACKDEKTLLTVVSPITGSVQWMSQNNVILKEGSSFYAPTGEYWVLHTDLVGCRDSSAVVVMEDLHSCISCNTFIPSAFHPDGDLINDEFALGFTEECELVYFQLLVFDRWGEVIFKSKTPELNWKGDVKGIPAQIGVYGYVVDYQFLGGKQRKDIGTVSLIR